jgi:hypothetical protein
MRIVNQSTPEPGGAAELGPRRPGFGLSRDPLRRIEISLVLRGGGGLTVYAEVDAEITAERLDALARELADDVSAGRARAFSDSWSATGQRTWVNCGEVVAFSLRQAK